MPSLSKDILTLLVENVFGPHYAGSRGTDKTHTHSHTMDDLTREKIIVAYGRTGEQEVNDELVFGKRR